MADIPTLGPSFTLQIYRGALLNFQSLSTARHTSKNNRSHERDLPGNESGGGGVRKGGPASHRPGLALGPPHTGQGQVRAARSGEAPAHPSVWGSGGPWM